MANIATNNLDAKAILNSPAYQDQKRKLNKEINDYPLRAIRVDQKVFKKSDKEKTILANLRKQNRDAIRQEFGPGTKNLNITANKIIPSIRHTF